MIVTAGPKASWAGMTAAGVSAWKENLENNPAERRLLQPIPARSGGGFSNTFNYPNWMNLVLFSDRQIPVELSIENWNKSVR